MTVKEVWDKRSQIAKIILRIKNKAGGFTLPDFTLYSKLQSSKQYGTGTRRDTVESPEINLCPYGQLIYDKGGKNMQ